MGVNAVRSHKFDMVTRAKKMILDLQSVGSNEVDPVFGKSFTSPVAGLEKKRFFLK